MFVYFFLQLFLFNFYPFLQRYLQPHQRGRMCNWEEPNISRIKNTIASIWLKKNYACTFIFVLGHYLSLEACSFPWALLSEKFSLLGKNICVYFYGKCRLLFKHVYFRIIYECRCNVMKSQFVKMFGHWQHSSRSLTQNILTISEQQNLEICSCVLKDLCKPFCRWGNRSHKRNLPFILCHLHAFDSVKFLIKKLFFSSIRGY